MHELETILNYKFKNPLLLQEALTHPSINKAYDKKEINYERLEFLGDSVLSLVLTDILLKKFPQSDEGDLAKKRSYLVKGDSLAKIAYILGLEKFILLSATEEKHGGRSNDHILENVVESIIGAIYLDGGFEYCQKFISANWKKLIENVKVTPIEPKTFVQEWAQNIGLPFPEYIVTQKTGDDHSPEFTIQIHIPGYQSQTGIGKSKKAAEKKAAQLFINNVINVGK